MSEAEGTTTPEAPAEAPAPAEALPAFAAAEAAVEAPVAAPAEEVVDLDTEPADDVWSDPAKAKAYGEKLRKEAAANRVKAKEAGKAFEGWAADDVEVLTDTIQTALKDPKVGAARMREIADLLDKGDVQGAADAAADASDDAAAVLTAEDVEAKVQEALSERDRKAALDAKTQDIIHKAKDLGYDPADEASRDDYFTLLHIAQTQTNGDLDKAHEKIQARNQAVIDRYVEGVRAKAAGAPLHAGRGEAAVIEPTGENKTFDTARQRTEARIHALRSGSKAS